MVKDPVCKMSLEPGSAAAVADYAGRTFYFCSENCHAKFTADPAAYAGAQRRHPGRAPIVRASGFGILAVAALLLLYFGLVSLVSGWGFMLEQFAQFWPYLIALALGFGIQVGLYIYLRTAVHAMHGAGKIVAVSGTTSGAAMVSCCAHYLVNLLPALGATGFVALLGEYQVQFFWVGLAANAAGIVYIGRRVVQFVKEV